MPLRPRLQRGRRALVPTLEALSDRALPSGLSTPVANLAAVQVRSEPERLIAKFRPELAGNDRQALLSANGLRAVTDLPGGTAVLEAGLGVDAGQALRVLQSSPWVIYAEPNATIRLTDVPATLPSVTPNYPRNTDFGQQWGLNSTVDVDIDAPEAWNVTTGSPSTIVAILDSGIDLKNPAFAGRIWVNPEASGPRNKVFGWNFASDNGDVQDQNGHGTHVAGIIAATGNGGGKVVGVDWRSTIMPLKILGPDGSGSLDDAVAAIYFAADHGARVINASWGSNVPNQALADAILYAGQRGVVVVNAAGNESVNSDLVATYPAAYDLPNLLVVGAIDASGRLASFSNYGTTTVDLAAPGVNILSTYPSRRGSLARLSGTSMATPFVTGVVSLLVGMHPEWSSKQLVDRILATTKPLASLAGMTATGGIVDAAQAVGVAGSGPDGNRYTGPPSTGQRSRNNPAASRNLVRNRRARARAGFLGATSLGERTVPSTRNDGAQALSGLGRAARLARMESWRAAITSRAGTPA